MGWPFNQLPLATGMSAVTRVLMVDLLVERAAFGHGGNQEVVRPFAARGDVEMLLVTPQMQSFEAGAKAESGDIALSEEDVPHWDDDFHFWQSTDVELEGRDVSFRRIVMPMHEDDSRMGEWLEAIGVDAVVCSGSRRNVSSGRTGWGLLPPWFEYRLCLDGQRWESASATNCCVTHWVLESSALIRCPVESGISI